MLKIALNNIMILHNENYAFFVAFQKNKTHAIRWTNQQSKSCSIGQKNNSGPLIATDHQPLVTTLGKQSVADVPYKRLARIKEKLMYWRFNMVYNPGKMQNAADASQDANHST